MFCPVFLCFLCLSYLLVLGFYKESIYLFYHVCFYFYIFCGLWEGWDPINKFNHIHWVTASTPTDSTKSVCNRYVIEVAGGGCVCVVFFSLGIVAFVIGLSCITCFYSTY